MRRSVPEYHCDTLVLGQRAIIHENHAPTLFQHERDDLVYCIVHHVQQRRVIYQRQCDAISGDPRRLMIVFFNEEHAYAPFVGKPPDLADGRGILLRTDRCFEFLQRPGAEDGEILLDQGPHQFPEFVRWRLIVAAGQCRYHGASMRRHFTEEGNISINADQRQRQRVIYDEGRQRRADLAEKLAVSLITVR